MADIHKQIQALLFSEGGSLTYKSLARSLSVSEDEIKTGLTTLSEKLVDTGLAIIRSDTEASLVVVPEAREAVVKDIKEDEARSIGDAGLEILAILLYEGPATRAQIDYVRGVNSSSTIRSLLTRGLIERSGNPEDGREYIYRATTDLLAHVGATSREDLPEYGTIASELAAFKAGQGHANDHGSESRSSENTAV